MSNVTLKNLKLQIEQTKKDLTQAEKDRFSDKYDVNFLNEYLTQLMDEYDQEVAADAELESAISAALESLSQMGEK